MDITAIPFNQLVGLQREPEGSAFAVSLPASSVYHNHLGIVHAAAQLTLAEAASGEWMIRNYSGLADRFVPVVRRIEAKFRRPAHGRVRGVATLGDEARRQFDRDLGAKRLVSVELAVKVCDESGAEILTATVEWCMTRRSPAS